MRGLRITGKHIGADKKKLTEVQRVKDCMLAEKHRITEVGNRQEDTRIIGIA